MQERPRRMPQLFHIWRTRRALRHVSQRRAKSQFGATCAARLAIGAQHDRRLACRFGWRWRRLSLGRRPLFRFDRLAARKERRTRMRIQVFPHRLSALWRRRRHATPLRHAHRPRDALRLPVIQLICPALQLEVLFADIQRLPIALETQLFFLRQRTHLGIVLLVPRLRELRQEKTAHDNRRHKRHAKQQRRTLVHFRSYARPYRPPAERHGTTPPSSAACAVRWVCLVIYKGDARREKKSMYGDDVWSCASPGVTRLSSQ